MTNAAIVIGVDRTGKLTPLNGAASGATKFAAWARGQGMSVTLITDDNGHEVTLTELQDAVEAVNPNRDCQKLIVYFAGHGVLLTANTELWLLSKAPGRASEAVNVEASRYSARYSGIDHVIFVSDACRSGGSTHQHRSVEGASIFPTPENNSFDGKIDTFYATRPGDTALEYKTDQEAVDNYRGIFTECLLDSLAGKEPAVVHRIQEGSQVRGLVLSDLLDEHLRTEVPLRAEAISIQLNQRPVASSESRLPQFFGEVDVAQLGGPPPLREHLGVSQPTAPDIEEFVAEVQEEVMSLAETTDAAQRAVTSDAHRLLVEQMGRIVGSPGRDHYETETGFTIYGEIRSAIAGDDLSLEPFMDGDVTHIRVIEPHDHEGRSILIEFASGFGAVLAIIPGFIGTVVIENDQVVNVNYTPSSNTSLFRDEYIYVAERVERRRAFAAASARHGVFHLDTPDQDDAGQYLRMDKHLDPTLGIYAAYAYFQAGQMPAVRSVFRFMATDPPLPVVPFDVGLLAGFPDDYGPNIPPLAPFCPMLRQGWSLLDLNPKTKDTLRKYRPLLVPSLWTMFAPEGVELVRSDIEAGELR